MTVRPTSHDTLPSIWETDVAVHLCVGNAYGNFVDNTVKHELPQLPWFTSEPSQHKYSKVPEIPSETNPLSTDDKNHQNLRHDHVAAQSLDLGPSESDASHCASNNAAGLSKKPHAVNERDRRRLENDVLRALEDLVRHGIRQELTALSANNRTEMGPSSSKLSILFGAYCEIKDLRRILDKLNDACGNFETRFEGVCDLQIAEMSQEQWHQIEDLNHLMMHHSPKNPNYRPLIERRMSRPRAAWTSTTIP